MFAFLENKDPKQMAFKALGILALFVLGSIIAAYSKQAIDKQVASYKARSNGTPPLASKEEEIKAKASSDTANSFHGPKSFQPSSSRKVA